MVPYLLCFGLSILATYLSSKWKYTFGSRNIKTINNVFSIIAVFIPCFMAAVRDSSIGYDIALYGDGALTMAKMTSTLSEFFTTYNIEKLYMLIAFFCGKYANRYVYYFILQLLVVGPIYAALQRKETKQYSWLGMLLYFCWMYAFSLNIMRQSIAIAFIIWGYKYVRERKFVKFSAVIVVAMGFHITAFFGLLLYVINVFIVCKVDEKPGLRKRLNAFRPLSKVLMLLAVLALFVIGVEVMNMISVLTGRFSFVQADAFVGLEFQNIIIMLIVIVIMYMLGQEVKDVEMQYIIFIAILGSILYQLKLFSAQMYRMSMYFTMIIFIGFPMFFNKNKSNLKPLLLAAIALISVFNFWLYNVCYLWHSVYPYSSSYLGI